MKYFGCHWSWINWYSLYYLRVQPHQMRTFNPESCQRILTFCTSSIKSWHWLGVLHPRGCLDQPSSLRTIKTLFWRLMKGFQSLDFDEKSFVIYQEMQSSSFDENWSLIASFALWLISCFSSFSFHWLYILNLHRHHHCLLSFGLSMNVIDWPRQKYYFWCFHNLLH